MDGWIVILLQLKSDEDASSEKDSESNLMTIWFNFCSFILNRNIMCVALQPRQETPPDPLCCSNLIRTFWVQDQHLEDGPMAPLPSRLSALQLSFWGLNQSGISFKPLVYLQFFLGHLYRALLLYFHFICFYPINETKKVILCKNVRT